MTIKIDFEKGLELLRAAIEEKGADYRYEKSDEDAACTYTTLEGAPSCIVGHALARAGADLTKLHEYEWKTYLVPEEEGEPYADSTSISTLINANVYAEVRPDVEVDVEALILFSKAQSQQDQGASWGDAVEKAERFVQDYRESQGVRTHA